ncbi:MAG: hypothetical protein EXS08_13135 [Planctomycetes bacterium]|nr:hypothetical protein [Planctomycetota bacterium]
MSLARPSPLKILLLTALLCLIWGSTWVVIQKGLADMPPFGSVALRFTLGATIMSALAARFAEREGGVRPSLALSLMLGGLNFGVSFGLVYWTETKLPSGLVSVLWAVFPMLQAIVGHLFLPGERIGPAQGFGFALGFLGVAALFATDLAALGPGAVPAGALYLLSPLASAIGTTYVKRHGAGTSSLQLNRNAMWIATAILWTLALVFERDAHFAWSPGAVASIVYLALFGSVTAFGLYFWLLRHVPANRMSVIAYVTPAIALSFGALFGDEHVGAWTLAGLGAILTGVFLVHRGGLPRKPEVARAPASS